MHTTLTSSAFEHGDPIPVRHTGDGEDLSPDLQWTGVPPGTAQVALICSDPDARTPRPWIHWLLYGLPPTIDRLAAGVPTNPMPGFGGGLQGKNSWGTIGYRGPAPPPGDGVHHYHFRLLGLTGDLNLEPGLVRSQLLKAIEGRLLFTAELVGTYQRR
ncbi:YbhB/YbcL family Raf kinase inhibitor-like protein [Planctomycetota bacterium]